MNPTQKPERGQVLIIFVFAIIGLIAIAGLAIDGGNIYSDRSRARNAADAAALAGAMVKVNEQIGGAAACSDVDTPSTCGALVKTAALDTASGNGYSNNITNNTVEVHIPPIDGPYANCAAGMFDCHDYVEVVISTNVDTYFAKVVGIRQLHNRTTATAIAKANGSGGFGGGNGLMVLNGSGTPLEFTGSGDVTVTGGIVDNSNFSSTGSGDFNVTGGVQVRGSINQTGSGDWNVGGGLIADSLSKTGSQNWTVSGGAAFHSNFSQTGSGSFRVTSGSLLYGGSFNPGSGTVTPAAVKTNPAPALPATFADPLASILNPPADPGCSPNNGDKPFSGSSNHTLAAGCYGAVSQSGSGNLTLNPGRFTSISNSGSGTLTLRSGVYYITGSDGISSSGSGDVVGNGVLIYLKTGEFDMTGSGDLNLMPMTTGAYSGLTVYLDRSNATSFSMTGSGDSTFSGTVYAPAADIILTGSGTPFLLHSQMVASTVSLRGSGGLNINSDANYNYHIPVDGQVGLVK